MSAARTTSLPMTAPDAKESKVKLQSHDRLFHETTIDLNI